MSKFKAKISSCSQAICSHSQTHRVWPLTAGIVGVPGVLLRSGASVLSCMLTIPQLYDLQMMTDVYCNVPNSCSRAGMKRWTKNQEHFVMGSRTRSSFIHWASSNGPIQLLDWCHVANFSRATAPRNDAQSSSQQNPRHLLFSFLLCCELSCDYGDRNVAPTNPGVASRRGHTTESIAKLGSRDKAARIQRHGTWMA